MKELGITPGPWRIERKENGLFNIVAGADYFSRKFVAFTGADATEDDARLIATAPELYEALRQLIVNAEIAKAMLPNSEEAAIVSSALFDTISQGDRALARARGESQG